MADRVFAVPLVLPLPAEKVENLLAGDVPKVPLGDPPGALDQTIRIEEALQVPLVSPAGFFALERPEEAADETTGLLLWGVPAGRRGTTRRASSRLGGLLAPDRKEVESKRSWEGH